MLNTLTNDSIFVVAPYLRIQRQTFPPDVKRQNPNLCLLSMSVSTKVKCCPTWFWDTLKNQIQSMKPLKHVKHEHLSH